MPRYQLLRDGRDLGTYDNIPGYEAALERDLRTIPGYATHSETIVGAQTSTPLGGHSVLMTKVFDRNSALLKDVGHILHTYLQ